MDHKRKTEEESPSVEKRSRIDAMPRFEKELGNSVFVVVNEFRGQVLIHIRKYDEKNGKKYPTKTGAALNLTRWNEFVTWLPEIEDSVNKLSTGEEKSLRATPGRELARQREFGVSVREYSKVLVARR